MPSRVVVTGASGFIGGTLLASLARDGHSVVSAGRHPPTIECEHRHFDLRADMPAAMFRGADVVFHCAYDLRVTDAQTVSEVNVGGTERLVNEAARSGARVVLISSMSAYEGTGQLYGRAKLQCESAVRARAGNVVRLGLVWGGASGGLIGTLDRLSQLPLIPVLGQAPYQYTVHADDMAAALSSMVSSVGPTAPVGLAHSERVPFQRIIRTLSGTRQPRFVTVPWQPVYLALRTLERIKVPLPVRADSLLGLVHAAPEVPNAQYWDDLGINLRQFPA